MLNIHELERRWLNYKIRSFLPAIAAVATVFVLLVAAVFVWSTAPVKPASASAPETPNAATASTIEPEPAVAVNAVDTSIQQRTTSKSTPSDNIDPALKAKNTPEPEPAVTSLPAESSPASKPPVDMINQAVVLKPSLEFMHAIEEKILPSNEKVSQPETVPEPPVEKAVEPRHAQSAEQPAAKPSAPIIEHSTTASVAPPETLIPPTEEKTRITIITKEDTDDLKDVLRRFSKNKNPALSLFAAKRYYDMTLYQKAYNYALITNEIDNGIEESWLIFAKSLVKLDQKEKAVETLKSYIEHSHSMKARMLLEDIQQGRFK